MSLIVRSKSLSGETDQYVEVSNDELVRPLEVDDSWTRIRIGIRFQFTNTGADLSPTNPPRFALGICSGSAGFIAGPTYFVGGFTTPATWTFTAASGSNMAYYFTDRFSGRKIGSTITNGVHLGTTVVPCDPSTTTRRLWIMDIIKGSPNYSVYSLACGGGSIAASPDALEENFYAVTNISLATTPQFPNHSFSTAGSIAVASGFVFDHFCCSWDQSSIVLQVSDVAVAVMI